MARALLNRFPVPRATVLVLSAMLALLGPRVVVADDPCQPILSDWQRRGYVAVSSGWPQQFDVAVLNAGWAADHQIRQSFPAGMDRALVMSTRTGYQLDPVSLGAIVDANPGGTWLLGSEPDNIYNDNALPEEYARIYHDLYTFIKGRDAMAWVAAGGIVQPTPIRLAYLDLVLAAYQSAYGEPLPADLWHIHNAILNEQRNVWGASIPPGIDLDEGVIREIDDNDNVAIFEEQVWAFRQWMADRGYGGYPLIISEYGVLMPDDYGFTEERVNRFMTNTFQFLGTATDPVLGDPGDGFRLVQRWAWFSLDVPPWDPITDPYGFNGNLFDPDTFAITAFGQNYAALTAPVLPAVHADLGPSRWQLDPVPIASSPAQPVTATVRVRVVNGGTVGAAPFTVALQWHGPTSGSAQHVGVGLLPASSTWLEFSLHGLLRGHYQLTVHVDPLDEVPESAECNNVGAYSFFVPTTRVTLPVISIHKSIQAVQDIQYSAPGFVEFEPPAASTRVSGVRIPVDGAP